MWLGVDDTDSPLGGCTTWVLTEILALARDRGVDLLGEPRLVRLNPNIPWKTRGNAALSAHFGRGLGPRTCIGSISQEPVWSFRAGHPLPSGEEAEFREAAWARILDRARGEKGTDPAAVVSRRRLPSQLYWRAVQDVVPVASVLPILEASGAWWRVRGDPRGLVGASASIAWAGNHATWELTAYRFPDRWGTARDVDAESVRAAARRHPELFLCHDPRTRRLLVAPHTPCPILFGVRATDPNVLLAARGEIRSEPIERWVLFRTNQASGDHLRPRRVREIAPYTSARLWGRVLGAPVGLPGGHVRISVLDSEGAPCDCLAFEPSKTLPRIVRALVPGDRVSIAGSRAEDTTFRLEVVRLAHPAPRFGPPRGPLCPECGRRAKSMGRTRGYRCPSCRRRWPPEAAVRIRRAPPPYPREYHPTPSARRHLHPLAPEP